MQKLHDPILQADFVRLNELLDVKDDADQAQLRDLHNEATQIRRKLASDTLTPDWLRDLARFVVGELDDTYDSRPDETEHARTFVVEDPNEVSELHVVGPGPNGYAVTDDRGNVVADGLSLSDAQSYLS